MPLSTYADTVPTFRIRYNLPFRQNRLEIVFPNDTKKDSIRLDLSLERPNKNYDIKGYTSIW